MATAQALTTTYSFIGPFLADPVLSKFGDNTLPLFALTLHLDVEDVVGFASDSLTDHPSDKKADIIYINEAEGVACVAQGYTSKKWAKSAAPANKACDLNTAAAWLLQAPIDKVPMKIRAHAKLLRDGLSKKTIKRVIFAYAHNALESESVESELKTVQHLLSGLQLLNNATVEVIELGLRRTEELYLTSLGSIQVADDIHFPANGIILEQGRGWKAYVLSLNGTILHDLYEKHQNALFSANLRDFLGARKVQGNVNNRIKETAERSPGNFFVFNNGITMVTKKASLNKTKTTLRIKGVSVVNGAQTTGAIHAAGAANAKNVSVLARVITVDDANNMIPAIVAANNTQNSIVAWDRRSNDPVQVRIRHEFQGVGVEYFHRRDNTRKAATSLFADQVGQILCAFGGDLQTAIRAKADIFESDVTYPKVFPATLDIGHIFLVQTLGWAYDRVKSQLKAKSSSGKLTNIEERQLRLLDYPASKQFLICVAGALREEIAGTKIADPKLLVIKKSFINQAGSEGIAAWSKILRSILPSMVQKLPAEEYEVVRSTEHTATVSNTLKGLVAGLEAFQSTFDDLRKLLGPINR